MSAYTRPPTGARSVTPSDSVDLDPRPARALWVGVSGDVAVTFNDGTQVTLPAVAAGMWHPMYLTRVRSTGTTATGIFVGY